MDNIDKYCTIKIINSSISNKILISTSLFYLENSYKNVSKYINGLTKLVEFINLYKYYTLRIYYDDSIFENLDYANLYIEFKTNKHIELINYKCTQFIINNNNNHIGTFGTLIRFLPLFEKSNYDYIYISDIDDKNYEYIDFYIKQISKKPYQIYLINTHNYGKRYYNYLENKFNFTAIANIFVKKYRFNIKILLDYLELLSNQNNLIYKKLEEINIKFFSNNINKYALYTYGIDEYFLNKYMLKNISKKIVYILNESLSLTHYVKHLFIHNENNDLIIKKYLIEIITTYYPNINSKWNIYNLIKFIVYSTNIVYSSNNKINKLFYKKYVINKYIHNMNMIKNITNKYALSYPQIFNKIYLDELNTDNFLDLNWTMKTSLHLYPKNFISKFKI